MIMAPEFTLSYLSDTEYMPELLEDHEGADVLILNTVNPFTIKTENNLNSEAAVKLISHLKPKLSVITHFSIKMLQADPIVEAREISRQTGHQIIAAGDGLSLNPSTYSAKRRQKTLKSF
jgi:phosphoribosyl 1,2-cyclic phosphodiesterase